MDAVIDAAMGPFLAACHRVAANGLVVGSAGNVSTRIEDRVLVTPTGGELADLTADSVVCLALDTGERLSPGRPTSEVDLHLGLLRRFPEMTAVVHTHSRAAAAFAVARREIPFVCNESLSTHAGAIRVSEPYAPPGTRDLARAAAATFEAEPGARAILLANHGPVVIGETVDQAVTLAIQVEWIADIYYRACALGSPHVIGTEDQRNMARNYGSSYRPMEPAQGSDSASDLEPAGDLKSAEGVAP